MSPALRPFIAASVVLAVALVLVGCKGGSDDHAHHDHDGHDHGGAAIIEVADHLAEIACGQCLFELKGTGCDLAVRLDGKTYFVDGAHIDDFGDAHAKDGLCNIIRKARVTGKVQNGRFIATKIEPVENAAGG